MAAPAMSRLGHLLRKGTGLLGAASPYRAFASSSAAMAANVDVLDPLLLFEPQRLKQWRQDRKQGSSQGHVTLSLPDAMVPVLQGGGKMVLGDMDDPMSSWQFGAQGEIFQYSFAGTHTVVSGWTCMCRTSVVQQIEQGTIQLGSWQTFTEIAKNNGGEQIIGTEFSRLGLPLLFAGRLLDCPSASVYKLPKSGPVSGILISNDYESIDD